MFNVYGSFVHLLFMYMYVVHVYVYGKMCMYMEHVYVYGTCVCILFICGAPAYSRTASLPRGVSSSEQ